MLASDISRGIDVMSWTGKPNTIGAAPAAAPLATTGDAGLALAGLIVLPAAAVIGRRRSRATV